MKMGILLKWIYNMKQKINYIITGLIGLSAITAMIYYSHRILNDMDFLNFINSKHGFYCTLLSINKRY